MSHACRPTKHREAQRGGLVTHESLSVKYGNDLAEELEQESDKWFQAAPEREREREMGCF